MDLIRIYLRACATLALMEASLPIGLKFAVGSRQNLPVSARGKLAVRVGFPGKVLREHC